MHVVIKALIRQVPSTSNFCLLLLRSTNRERRSRTMHLPIIAFVAKPGTSQGGGCVTIQRVCDVVWENDRPNFSSRRITAIVFGRHKNEGVGRKHSCRKWFKFLGCIIHGNKYSSELQANSIFEMDDVTWCSAFSCNCFCRCKLPCALHYLVLGFRNDLDSHNKLFPLG